MTWSRAIVVAAALFLVVIVAVWWLFGRGIGRELGMSADAVAGNEAVAAPAPRPAPSPPAPLPPLPRLTLRAGGAATVEVKLRGTPRETGCATEGTGAPLCPGEYDVRASGGGQTALAVVRLNRGDVKELELERKLQRQSMLELMVTDSDRLPVDRARVTAQHTATGYVLEGRTDSDGTASLGPVVPGDFLVMAHRDGWAPAAGLATAGRQAKLELQVLSRLEGVVSLPTGVGGNSLPTGVGGNSLPAGGVRVALATLEHVVMLETVIDGGAFALGLAPPGKYELVVDSDRLEPHVEPVSLPASSLTVRVSTGATLKGDLLGPGRERLDGEVSLDGPGGTRTVTARSGAFEARGLAAGRWTLRSGRGRAVADVADGGVSRIELNVPLFGGVITGTCAFAGGHRLPAEVIVRARRDDGEESAAPCEAGRFELHALERGFYTLEVEAREGTERWSAPVGPFSTGARDVAVVVPGVAWLGYRLLGGDGRLLTTYAREHFESRDLELPLEPGPVIGRRDVSLERGRDTDAGDFAFTPGVNLTGRVLDAVTKDPVEGATVSVEGLEFKSDTSGRFVASASEGDVSLQVSHPRYVTASRAVAAPAELDVELKAAARAVGAVITADGGTALGLEIWAMSEQGTFSTKVEGGTFATPHLADGHWLLRVAGDGALSGFDTVELDIKGSGDRPVLLVERAAGLDFDAMVTDRTGAPAEADLLLVPRAAQAPSNEQELERLLRLPGLVADPTGKPARYRFSRVPPGGYTLLARARGRIWTAAVPVLVKSGMAPVSVAFPQLPYAP